MPLTSLHVVAIGFCFSVGIAVGIVGCVMGSAAQLILIHTSLPISHNSDLENQTALITTEKAQHLLVRQMLIAEATMDIKRRLITQVWSFYRPKQSADGMVFWFLMKLSKPVFDKYSAEIRLLAGILRFFLPFILGILLHYI